MSKSRVSYQNAVREELEFRGDPSLLVYTEEDGPYTSLVFADADVRLPRLQLYRDAWVVLAGDAVTV